MKVVFTVPRTDIDTAGIQIENKFWTVKSLMPVMTSISITLNSNTDNVNVYVNIPAVVQGAGYGASDGALTYTPALNFETMDSTKIVAVKNFQMQTIAKFTTGNVYLIPSSAFGILPIVPNILSAPISGINATYTGAETTYPVFVASKFPYQCDSDTTLLNNTSVANVITLNIDGPNAVFLENQKNEAKKVEAINFATATGAISVNDVPSLLADSSQNITYMRGGKNGLI